MRRKRLKKRVNKRNFAYTARKLHKKNLYKKSQRGGIRL